MVVLGVLSVLAENDWSKSWVKESKMWSYDNILLPFTFNVPMFHPLECDLEGALYVSK
jgi:hypothetical protein